MTTPLLSTKLYIPPLLPNLISRPHLIGLLNNEVYNKLTLISAPAGFGKSTLISAWGQQAELQTRVAWLSLGVEDNDLTRFLTYIIAAFQTIDSNIGDGLLAALQSPGAVNIEAILTTLLNEITEFPEYVFLVLDDYHMIKSQPIDKAITFTIDHMPSKLQLVIATREDPALPLARWRTRGQMTEIRASDLRFTPEEATAFLNQTMGLDLTPDDIIALEARTEGWIAGLHLAAISLQGHADRAAFIQSFAGDDRHVMDYLVGEVLSLQPESVKRFLLQTSILERMSGPLCDMLMDGDETSGNSQSILEQLEQVNLFIVLLDNRRQWYRYHHLFADLLRSRLRRVYPERIPDLRRRARTWYEQNDLITEALGHALAGEDLEQSARLVAENALPMLIRGEVTTVQGWLDALPQEIVRSHPRLCIDKAWVLHLTKQPDVIEPLLQDAERGLESSDFVEQAATSAWLGEVFALRAWIKRCQGELTQAIELSYEALKRLTEENVFALCLNLVSLAGALRYVGDTAQAVQVLTDCIPLCKAAGNPLGVMADTYDLAELRVMQGQLHQAKTVLEDALKWASAHSEQQISATSMVYQKLGDVLREQNDLQAAEDHLLTSINLSKGELAIVSGQAYLSLARVKQAQGDAAGVRSALQQAEQAVRGWETPEIVAELMAHRARMWLTQEALPDAIRWIQESKIQTNQEPNYLHEFELLTLGRVLIAQGSSMGDEQPLYEAIEMLDRLRRKAEEGGRMGRVLEIMMLQALALSQIPGKGQALEVSDETLDLLGQALALAEPEGYVRMFIDEGAPMARLLYQAVSRGIASEYASRLLSAFPDVDPALPKPPSVDLVEPLSAREGEVLGIIAEGLTNQEIAAKLHISLNTVKVHSSNIYSKLGVNSRTQAVAKAKVLGILPTL